LYVILDAFEVVKNKKRGKTRSICTQDRFFFSMKNCLPNEIKVWLDEEIIMQGINHFLTKVFTVYHLAKAELYSTRKFLIMFFFTNISASLSDDFSSSSSLYWNQCCQNFFFKNRRCWRFFAKKEHFVATTPVLLHFYVVMYLKNIAKWLKLAILPIFLSSKIAGLATNRHFWQYWLKLWPTADALLTENSYAAITESVVCVNFLNKR